ncbi:MAG: hypothetical protein ACRD3J_05310 [Thermoanaerobaculia bacterium]
MHEETIFYSRLNFFLLFESLLFGFVLTTGATTESAAYRLRMPVVALGIAVSLVWAYAQRRKLSYLKVLEKRLPRHLPEFKETVDLARKSRRGVGGISANGLIDYAIPPIVILAWVAIAVTLVDS